MPKFELSIPVFTLEEMDAGSLAPYDAVILGDPFCRDYQANLAENSDDLARAVEMARKWGKKVYVATYAVPRQADLPHLERSLPGLADLGVDGIEIHNLGALRLAHTLVPGIPIQMGVLSNLYTDLAVARLAEYGVSRVTMSPELSLEESALVQERTGIEVTVTLHGQMVLGISEGCLLKRWRNLSSDDCPRYCAQEYWLRSGELELRSFGRATLSGRHLCLIEHLDLLLELGFSIFRIDVYAQDPSYRGRVGEIYRRALEQAGAKKYDPQSDLEELRGLSRGGLCNGYAFQVSGSAYVSASGRPPRPAVPVE